MNNILKWVKSAGFILLLFSSVQQLNAQARGDLSKAEANAWLKDNRRLFGDLTPDKSINKQELAKQYNAHPEWWEKAFAYLRETDFANMKPGKYSILGDDVFATISETKTRELEKTRFESHKVYADIHYVFEGKEKMGIAPVEGAVVIEEYDAAREIMFHDARGKYYEGNDQTFFVVFPGKDAHRPGIKAPGFDSVKKVVIKIRAN